MSNTNPPIKPATSIYFRYKKPTQPSISDTKSITIQNKTIIQKSHPSTYFCTIGFYPGGYCGIQQRENEADKIFIFSLWNDGNNNVELVDKNEHAVSQKFGNEGIGLKTTMFFDWFINEPIETRIEIWKSIELPNCTWHVSCWFRRVRSEPENLHSVNNSESRNPWIFIAEYKRNGKTLLSDEGLFSFIEDYQRSIDGSQGHQYQRKALFGQMTWNDQKVTEFRFTKVEDSKTLDFYAKEKCFATTFCCPENMALMSTGGRVEVVEKECLELKERGSLYKVNGSKINFW